MKKNTEEVKTKMTYRFFTNYVILIFFMLYFIYLFELGYIFLNYKFDDF
jgi:hypothetical protein